MGIVESVRAVMSARKRQPDQVAYGVALGHERFGPRELESSRKWKATLADEPYAEDVSDPARIGEIGEDLPDRKYGEHVLARLRG